jgi:electron transfer flavoprotein alpha subunit
MRIAVLVKQVPILEELRLGADGRLRRAGSVLELNPYCRRAVAKGVELARATGGACTVLTLGPPEAADALREALAWGADHGILVTDLAFAGSDTLATARALAAALRREGSFDLILTGRNSVDADTGQVAPQLAALLDLPHLGPVRELELAGGTVQARCERDDGYVCATVRLPAVLSAAERLCAPAKVPPAERALVPDDRIRTVTAADLGPGPWGAAGSPTAVGRTRLLTVERSRRRGSGPLADQVRAAARAVAAVTPGLAGVTPGLAGVTPGVAGVTPGLAGVSRRRVAPQPRSHGTGAPQPRSHGTVAVLAEPGRDRATRELLGAAQRLASRAVLLTAGPVAPRTAWSWHADELVQLPDAGTAEDAAEAVLAWCAGAPPWALLASSTCWGREVAARVAARLGAGLTGDAVELETVAGRLVCWKPAFGGQLVAAVTASSPTQLATVRPGALPLPEPRTGAAAIRVSAVEVSPRGRVRVTEVVRDDDPDALALARVVVGVGRGIAPAEYPDLKPLLELLDAELGATRKVTDLGWLPRSRQIGITGQSIAPDLYIALAVHGKLTHLAGVRGARFVLAVNADPSAPVFDAADFGIVGDWRDVVPLLVRELGGYVPGIVAKTV